MSAELLNKAQREADRDKARRHPRLRIPDGTSSSRSSTRRWAGVSSASSMRHRRCVVSSRTRATSRTSVVTPGSSTFRSRSQVIASRKIAFGPSPDVHARAATHSVSSASASAKSRSPYFRRISCWWSDFVFARSVYRFTTAGLAMPSCPATKSSTSPGTSSGSSRNVPSQRTVTIWSAKPAFMWSPRRRSTSFRSWSSRKNTRSRSACDGGPAYRPYAAASSSVRNSTGIDRTLGASQAVLTCSDQTVTRSCVDWPTHIGTTPGGNAPGFSSLSPVAVPLWADPLPRALPRSGTRLVRRKRPGRPAPPRRLRLSGASHGFPALPADPPPRRPATPARPA